MKLWPAVFGFVGGAVLWIADGSALATPPYPNLARNSLNIRSATRRYRPQRPVTSPYLALSQGNIGTNTAVNLFQLVQPMEAQNQINQNQGAAVSQLQTQVRQDQRLLRQEEEQTIRSTGNHAGFMTYQSYFGTNQRDDGGNPPPGSPTTQRVPRGR